MMGAMPAVAVRLERRKAEQRLKRPSQLYLSGYPSQRHQTGSPSRCASPSPSPLLSPPRYEDERLPEIYVCGRVSALHLAVVSLLLGAVILIVGLVQLKPGADAPGHKYYLIAVGCVLEVLGLIITATRCAMLHARIKKRRCSDISSRKNENVNAASEAGCRVEAKNLNIIIENQALEERESSSPRDVNQRHLHLKQLYNSSDVMYIDEMSDSGVAEGRAKSPGDSVSTIDIIMGEIHPEIVKRMECEPINLSVICIPSSPHLPSKS